MAFIDLSAGGFQVMEVEVPTGSSVAAGGVENIATAPVPGLRTGHYARAIPPDTLETGAVPIACFIVAAADPADGNRFNVRWHNRTAGNLQHVAKTWTFVVFAQRTAMYGAG